MATLRLTHLQLLRELCKALGIEGQPVSRIVIDIKANDLVKVYINRYLEDSEADQIMLLLGEAAKEGLVAKVDDVR